MSTDPKLSDSHRRNSWCGQAPETSGVRKHSTQAFGDRDQSASGGARRDRTDDLMLAKHALSQLSYGPLALARSAKAKGFPLASSAGARHPSAWLARRRPFLLASSAGADIRPLGFSRHQARRPVALAALRAGSLTDQPDLARPTPKASQGRKPNKPLPPRLTPRKPARPLRA